MTFDLTNEHIFAAGRIVGATLDPATEVVVVRNGVVSAIKQVHGAPEPHESLLTTLGGPVAIVMIGPLRDHMKARIKLAMLPHARELCEHLDFPTGGQRVFSPTDADIDSLLMLALLTTTKAGAILSGVVAKQPSFVIDVRKLRHLWQPLMQDLQPLTVRKAREMWRTEEGCQRAFNFAWSLDTPNDYLSCVIATKERVK